MRAKIPSRKFSDEMNVLFSRLINIFFITILFTQSSCAQLKNGGAIYAGSTPCDPMIKQMSGIPQEKNCEFMKWEMRMSTGGMHGNMLFIQVNYGMTRANTNGFADGSERLSWTGHLEKLLNRSSQTKNFFVVKTEDSRSLFYLVQLSENIFHFTDKDGKPLTGNGGWGYVLNRISENTASK